MQSANELGGTSAPFVVGTYSVEQVANLRTVGAVAPCWYVSDCPGDPLAGALDAKGRPDASRKRPRRAGGGNPKKWDDVTNANTLEEVLDAVAQRRAGCIGLLVHGMTPGSGPWS